MTCREHILPLFQSIHLGEPSPTKVLYPWSNMQQDTGPVSFTNEDMYKSYPFEAWWLGRGTVIYTVYLKEQ